MALNGCTVPGGRALRGEAPKDLQSLSLLGDQPSPTLWLFQEVFLFPLPLPEQVRDAPAPLSAVVRAEAGVHSMWGSTEHPAPLLPLMVGTVTYKAGDGGSALQKRDPPPRLSFCP